MTATSSDADSASNQPAEPIVVGYPDRNGVRVVRVTYPNAKAHTQVAANLFLPAALDASKPSAAVLVGHPFLGVKEQTSGLHAQLLAERGFIALAFDASHYGDSTGEPRFDSPAVPPTRGSGLARGRDVRAHQWPLALRLPRYRRTCSNRRCLCVADPRHGGRTRLLRASQPFEWDDTAASHD